MTPGILMTALVAICLVLMVVVQFIAMDLSIRGPVVRVFRDFAATPNSYTTPWAALGIAMIGIDKRWRIWSLSIALALDVSMALFRFLLLDNRMALGNGPQIVLVALAVIAAVRWTGDRREYALRGIGIGLVLLLSTSISETCLQITALTEHQVLDEYIRNADHALGNPSWLVGQLFHAVGPLLEFPLKWIYVELPFGAAIVAVYQLRTVFTNPSSWPSHYLVRTFILLGVIGPVFYFLLPVVGPVYAYGPLGGSHAIADYWPSIMPPLNFHPQPFTFDSQTPRNCMPSMHTAWALLIFIHSRQGARWIRWLGAIWFIGTLLATLGFGYHYGVDLVAGAVLCLTVESALRDPGRGWGWFRIRLVAGGTLAFTGLLLSYRFLSVPIAQLPAVSAPLILGALAAMATAFYATFFAKPGTGLAEWGRRPEELVAA